MSSTRPNFSSLLRLLQSQRSKLTIAITLACLAALLELPPYWIIYQALELGLAADTQAVLTDDFLLLAGWMLLALLLKYLAYSASYYYSHKAAYQVLADTRLSLLQHVSRANYQWLQQQGSGRIKQTIMQDVEELEAFIAHHTVETVTGFLMPVFVTIMLLALDWRLALAALAAIPLAALASWIPLSRLGKHFERFNQAAGQLNATMVEYVRNMPVMKAFCQDVKSFQHMRRQIDDYYALIGAVTHRTVPGWSLFTVLLTANAFLTLPLGIWLYQSQAISLPELMLALILAAGMLRPLLKLTNLSSEYQQVMTSLGNIMRLLQMPARQAQAVLQIDAQASIQLEQVAYSLAGKTLLHPCSLKINTPGMTAIVGPSGAGKSTLAKLMSGVLLPSAGSIKLHGQAMAEMLDEQRTQLITLVSQEVFLFKGSILENLLLAAPFASPLAIDTALRTAQAKSFVDALPLGLKTEIGERGLSLSGGERQRLAIARALLANTPLLILDEATAFADNLTEQRFLTALRQDYPHTMLIVISHRFQALEHAREIIVMDQGHIIAQGQHQDLLRQCLTYQSLWHRHKASVYWTLNRLPEQASASARGVA